MGKVSALVPFAMTQKPIWLSTYGNLLPHMTKRPLIEQPPESDLVAQLYHQGR